MSLNIFTKLTDLGKIELPKLPFTLQSEIVMLIVLILGLVLLFLGEKIIRFWLALTGILAGGYAGIYVAKQFQLTSPVQWIVIGLLALAGAFLLALAYKACFFIAGAVAGYMVGGYLLSIFMPSYPFYYPLIIGIIAAFLAVFLKDEFTIAATAITGSMLIADSLVAFIYKLQPGDLLRRVQTLNIKLADDLIILLAIAILSAIGIYTQKKIKHKH